MLKYAEINILDITVEHLEFTIEHLRWLPHSWTSIFLRVSTYLERQIFFIIRISNTKEDYKRKNCKKIPHRENFNVGIF